MVDSERVGHQQSLPQSLYLLSPGVESSKIKKGGREQNGTLMSCHVCIKIYCELDAHVKQKDKKTDSCRGPKEIKQNLEKKSSLSF